MKWFKHDSNANTDAKLKRVRMKYGMQGYGLYWYCLELIAANVEKHNLTFELEHDAEVISYDTGINYAVVQEMMSYMADLGLFENTDGLITCLKMASRTDEYTMKLLRSPDNVLTKSRHAPDKVPPIRIDKNRIEEKRIDKNITTKEMSVDRCVDDGFDAFWANYPKKTNKDAAVKAWKKLKPSRELAVSIITDCQKRVELGAWCTGAGKNFIPGAGPYLNNKRWTDEIIPRPEFKPKTNYSDIAKNVEMLK